MALFLPPLMFWLSFLQLAAINLREYRQSGKKKNGKKSPMPKFSFQGGGQNSTFFLSLNSWFFAKIVKMAQKNRVPKFRNLGISGQKNPEKMTFLDPFLTHSAGITSKSAKKKTGKNKQLLHFSKKTSIF